MNAETYGKPPLTLSAQVKLLESRGMRIEDYGKAEETLLRLNYYRFCGYALHFEEFDGDVRLDRFRAGTSFERVIQLHAFDERLRLLLMRHIGPLEIGFRTAVCYELALHTRDSHWYLDRSLYSSAFRYGDALTEWEREYSRSKEQFVKAYRIKYATPRLPPAWIMCEILSMGCWSHIYAGMRDVDDRVAVAQRFSIAPRHLKSWIHCMTVLRNLCAHHSRIWNRRFEIRPRLPSVMQKALGDNSRLAAQIAVLARLLDPLGRRNSFEQAWESLLDQYPDVPREPMGLPGTVRQGGQS